MTGETALHNAVATGHEGVVLLLLGHEANVNAANVNRVTPLFVTAQNGNERVVGILLKHHATCTLQT